MRQAEVYICDTRIEFEHPPGTSLFPPLVHRLLGLETGRGMFKALPILVNRLGVGDSYRCVVSLETGIYLVLACGVFRLVLLPHRIALSAEAAQELLRRKTLPRAKKLDDQVASKMSDLIIKGASWALATRAMGQKMEVEW